MPKHHLSSLIARYTNGTRLWTKSARSRRRSPRLLSFESLEDRQLLAVVTSFDSGKLTINVDGNEIVAITADNAGIVTVTGDSTGVSASAVQEIEINISGPGSDIDLSAVNRASFTALSSGKIRVNGGPGPDSIRSSEFDDIIRSGGGDDTIDVDFDFGNATQIGLGGNDEIDGGPGSDRLRVGGRDIVLRDGFIERTAAGEEFQSIFTNLESISLKASPFGSQGSTLDASAFTEFGVGLTGSDGDDVLLGGLGDDVLVGFPGDDLLAGGGGDDTLIGNAGDDTFQFVDPIGIERDRVDEIADELDDDDVLDFSRITRGPNQQGVEVNLAGALANTQETVAAHASRIVTAAFPTLAKNFESVLGSPLNDVITGNDQSNFLLGNAGADILVDGEGDDSLAGGPGDDTIRFTNATQFQRDVVNDPLDGGVDLLDFSLLTDPLEVDLSKPAGQEFASSGRRTVTTESFTNPHTGQVSGVPPSVFENVIGTPEDDIITGADDVNNSLTGGGGNDILRGNSGDDVLVGDTIGGIAPAAVSAASPLAAAENGVNNQDILVGGPGRDILRAGPGDDYLFGGPGVDELLGQEGADTFAEFIGNQLTDAKIDLFVSNVAQIPEVKVGQPVGWQYFVNNVGEDVATEVVLDAVADSKFSHVPLFAKPIGEPKFPNLPADLPHPRMIRPADPADPRGDLEVVNDKGVAIQVGVGINRASARAREAFFEVNSENNTDRKSQILIVGPSTFRQFGGGLGDNGDGPMYVSKLVPESEFSVISGDQPSNFADKPKGDPVGDGGPVFESGSANLDPNIINGPNNGIFLGDPVMIDVANDGFEGRGDVAAFQSTPDSRFFAFTSNATNLADEIDANDTFDVFLHDLFNRNTTLISANHEGTQTANGTSFTPSISPNGRFVAFTSDATDLVDGFTDNNLFGEDLFLHDVQTGQTQLVSVSRLDQGQRNRGANGRSSFATFSPDSRFLVFESTATDLVDGFVNANGSASDVYLYDTVTQQIDLVSVAVDGVSGLNGFTSLNEHIRVGTTEDRLRIVFESFATNYQDTLPDGFFSKLILREYPRDPATGNLGPGTTRPATTNNAGTEVRESNNGRLTPDGRFLVFTSDERDISNTPDGSSLADVFLKDLDTGQTELVSINFQGTAPANAGVDSVVVADLSDDGRYVAFSSSSIDLVDGFQKGNGPFDEDVFVRDMQRGATTHISKNADGQGGNGRSRDVFISSDGARVFFESDSTNLVEGALDTNGGTDIFVSSAHRILSLSVPEFVGDETLTLRRNGDQLELFSEVLNAVAASAPLDDLLGVNVAMSDAGNDTLVVDFGFGGVFALPDGITFDGGVGGNDALSISGGAFETVSYEALSADSGFVTLQNGVTSVISYLNLEPILDETAADSRVFETFLLDDGGIDPANVAIRVADDGDPDNGLMRIEPAGAAIFENITFAVPSESLTILGGDGNDEIRVESLDNGFTGELTLAGARGDDLLVAQGLTLPVTLDGGPGDDALAAGNADDRLLDGTGSDALDGGPGSDLYELTLGGVDTLIDPAGDGDTLDFSTTLLGVTLDLDLADPQIVNSVGDSLQLTGLFEGFTGSPLGDEVLVDFQPGVVRTTDGGDPPVSPQEPDTGDRLTFDALGTAAVGDGSAILVGGAVQLLHQNFEQVLLANLAPDNSPPLAEDDPANTDEDTTVVIDVLANDSDPDGDPLSIAGFTQPANGQVTDNGDGTFTYTPDADLNGADSFTYTASDDRGGTDDATVTIQIAPVNDAPLAADDNLSTDEDVAVQIPVLANDNDVDGDPLDALPAVGPSNGNLTPNGDGTFAYLPDPDFHGIDTFTYRASDGQLSSDIATVTITVDPVNDPPVANDDEFATDEGVPLNVAAPGLLANDTDVDGDPLTSVLVSAPANGQLALAADGSFIYTPDPGFSGTDGFTYRAHDGAADSEVADVAIEVEPADDGGELAAEILGPDQGVRGQPLTFTLLADRDGDVDFEIDFDGDGVIDQVVTGPSGSSVTHAFPETGAFSMSVTAVADGQTSQPAEHAIDIAALAVQPDPLDAAQQILVIGGTTGHDLIHISSFGGWHLRLFMIDGQSGRIRFELVSLPLDRVVVFAQEGDDRVSAGRLPSELHGGPGNDVLTGSRHAANILVGGPGDDLLLGSGRRDVLIGGPGRDLLLGLQGDDLLIGGSTAFDNDSAALQAISGEWNSSRSYQQRIDNLRGTGNGPAFDQRRNGRIFLTNTTVFDDQQPDLLAGASGRDWFFAHTAFDAADRIFGLAADELIDLL